MANPLAGTDQHVAGWFHAHQTGGFVTFLRALSEPGSGMWIGIILSFLVLFFVWKRGWSSLATIIVAVPGGMLLNELIKVLVQRQRPYLEGTFVDWSGYSFASGHTIGATLLYGQLALFLIPLLKTRHWKALTASMAALLVCSVGFSRIALGAHYFTDVLAAIFFGGLWLAFCLLAGKPLRRIISRAQLSEQVPVAAEVALVPVAAGQATNEPR
jgi:undecaprenyl-diphosphatase